MEKAGNKWLASASCLVDKASFFKVCIYFLSRTPTCQAGSFIVMASGVRTIMGQIPDIPLVLIKPGMKGGSSKSFPASMRMQKM